MVENNNAMVYIAIVAMVAIVALVVVINGNSATKVVSLEPIVNDVDANSAGLASSRIFLRSTQASNPLESFGSYGLPGASGWHEADAARTWCWLTCTATKDSDGSTVTGTCSKEGSGQCECNPPSGYSGGSGCSAKAAAGSIY